MFTSLLHCLVTLTVAAPAPSPAGGLSLDDAVRGVLARHPALEASRHAARGGEARADQARSAWLPRVTADGWYRYAGPNPELHLDTGATLPGAPGPLVIDRELGTPHSAGLQLTVGWRAFDFGARDRAIDAAAAAAGTARAEGAARAAEVAYASRAAYLGVLLFREVAAATERARDSALTTRADAEHRKAAGLGTDVAIAAADARVAELEARLIEARERGLRARATLRLLLGLPDDAPIEPTDTLVVLADGHDAPPLDTSAHPRLDGLAATGAALEHQQEALSRSAWPTIDLFARAGYQLPVTFIEDTAGVTYAAGVTLGWSLFDGALRSRQQDELEARRAELRAIAQSERETIARAELDAATRARKAAATIVAAERRVRAARTYLDAARGALGAGVGAAATVRDAEVALDGAEIGLVQARFEAAMAQADRLRARGVTGIRDMPGAAQ